MAQHRENCREMIRGIASGYGGQCGDFITNYVLIIQFDIECLGCCYDYLTESRRYRKVVGSYDRVHFTNGNAANVRCFVQVPGGSGQLGQISTTHMFFPLNTVSRRPFERSRTYQLYGTAADVRMGGVLTARMESLAIDVATDDELSMVHVSYADAALIELYRCSKGLPYLRGFCNLKEEHTIDVGKLSLF